MIVLTVIFSKHMLPTSYQFEAPEGHIQNTRLRGLTTPDPGNQGMRNGLAIMLQITDKQRFVERPKNVVINNMNGAFQSEQCIAK